MSRRTETAYKARFAGEFAQQNEALDSANTVNAAVVWQKFTFLSGETCSTCGRSGSVRGGNAEGDRAGVSRGRSSPPRDEGPNIETGKSSRMLSDRRESERRSGR
ncbi:MAG: hypothetical protein WA705_04895 [Candidatus Ozemobacteraceae bacterium]